MDVGDTVKVKSTDHITTITERHGIWYVLAKTHDEYVENYYGEHQLIKLNGKQSKFHKIKQGS